MTAGTDRAAGPARTTTTTRLVVERTPVGPLTLEADGGVLTGLRFGALGRTTSDAAPPDAEVLDRARLELAEYFARQREAFTVPLRPAGTPFQLRVWEQLRAIPYGTTICYGELARRVGDPRASRAVGTANGRNPISIIVPCHRVIGADGTLTGFGGGMAAKRTLIDLESDALF